LKHISTDIEVVIAEAEQVFGSAILANEWLHKFNLALGSSPLQYLSNANGKEEVTKILNAIAYGGCI